MMNVSSISYFVFHATCLFSSFLPFFSEDLHKNCLKRSNYRKKKPGPSEERLTCRQDVFSGKGGLAPAPRSERKILMLFLQRKL